MAIIQVNTDFLQKCVEDILKLSNDYDALVKEFFERMLKIDSTGIWIGENNENSSAKAFLQKTLKEQPNYIEFGQALNKCGEAMIQYAQNVDSVQKKNRIEG